MIYNITGTKYSIVFKPKGGSIKYAFAIQGEPELTKLLLQSVKTKYVKEKDFKYAVRGISSKVKELLKNKPDMKEKNILKPDRRTSRISTG